MQSRRHSRALRWIVTVATVSVSLAFAQVPPADPARPPEQPGRPAEPPNEQPTDQPTEKPTEPITNQPTENVESPADASTDVPVEPVPEKPPSPSEICVDENESRAVIDRVHSRLYKLTCSSASWFDGFFGDRRYDREYRATHGRVTVGTLWSQRDSVQALLRFRARLNLPQASQKLHAFVGRVDREDYLSESQPEGANEVTAQDLTPDDRSATVVGIGYSEPLKKRGSFDADVGMRISLPVDPYVKGSYRYARSVGERSLIRLRETIFWQQSERFGVGSSVDWDHAIGDDYLLRFTNAGTFSQNTEGVRWYSNLTLFTFISEKRALAYEVAASGNTDHEVQLGNYGAGLIYRQRVWRDWLLLELRGGVDWPRDWLFEERRYNLKAGIAFELRFGKSPDLSQDPKPIKAPD